MTDDWPSLGVENATKLSAACDPPGSGSGLERERPPVHVASADSSRKRRGRHGGPGQIASSRYRFEAARKLEDQFVEDEAAFAARSNAGTADPLDQSKTLQIGDRGG